MSLFLVEEGREYSYEDLWSSVEELQADRRA